MADQNQGISARLRAARMQQGLEIDALAKELKNPRAVLESIERGEWSRLGAPVFARHLVGRYASRLGVSVDLDEIVQHVEAPVLRSQVPTSRLGRLADFSTRHAAYVGGSLLVLPLVYAALTWTASGPVQYRALDPVDAGSVPLVAKPVDTATEAARDPGLAAADSSAPVAPGAVSGESADGRFASGPAPGPMAPVQPVAAAPTPVAASLAGTVIPASPQIELQFSGDSWIEVSDREGGMLERVLARAGESRRFPVSDVGRVTIGNVDATEVLVDGSRVNLEAVRAANVARFALSSDGSIEAVAR